MKRLGEVAATDCCLRNSHSVLILITPSFVYRRANIHHVYELLVVYVQTLDRAWRDISSFFQPFLLKQANSHFVASYLAYIKQLF